MQGPDRLVCRFGTTERPADLKAVQLGPLSFLYSQDGLRRIAWHGTELVRAICWPVRDESWGTYAPEDVRESLDTGDDAFGGKLTFTVAGGRLACDLRLSATEAGRLRADLTMTPTQGSFATNRAGYTVLHPIRGMAGAPLEVTHPDGGAEQTRFPRRISPDQPVRDIRGLRYGLDGATVDIAFEGEVFEMEDQRNWSDASFKTYCVPLVQPFTYTIDAPVTQSVVLTLAGAPAGRAASKAAEAALAWSVDETAAPEIALAVQPGWLAEGAAADLAARCGAGRLSIRMGPEADAGYLAACAGMAKALNARTDAEIVLQDGVSVPDTLASAARAMRQAGLTADSVLALPQGYLASYQPGGPWPEGPTPDDTCRMARAAFPDAAIGGGMMTNFTELNRCRPDPGLCDFITHGSSAIVHAADDLSVIETLEALPQIHESAAALAGGKPCRLGLVSIGMRSNPYGAAVADNPAQGRRAMARADPRQRGLFAAAWAVGVLAGTGGEKIASLCLAAPAGPFGIVRAPQPWPQPWFDATDAAVVFPLYHVVRAAAAMAGGARLRIGALPDGVFAYGAETPDGPRLMIANLSGGTRRVTLPEGASAAILDDASFVEAAARADWLDTADLDETEEIALTECAIAFVRGR